MEDNYWWYVGLRELVLYFIDKFTLKKIWPMILDAGCGTGGLLRRWTAYKAYGLDISEEAIKFCKLRKLNNIIKASICNIPFKNNSFDLLISLDVLYHIGVKSDIKALEEFYRLLDKGGALLLNLPAYDFLQSGHDKVIHTRHRYTLKELKQKVKKVGFTIEKISYRNTILFPSAFALRLIERILSNKKREAKSDLRSLPRVINEFLTQILLLENRLISVLNFPFGLSIFCIARKQ